jgi:hypothetical protein
MSYSAPGSSKRNPTRPDGRLAWPAGIWPRSKGGRPNADDSLQSGAALRTDRPKRRTVTLAQCVGQIDRSHSPRSIQVSSKRHFALATPCAHVLGRYSGPSNVKSRGAHPRSRDIGSSTSAAQKSATEEESTAAAMPLAEAAGAAEVVYYNNVWFIRTRPCTMSSRARGSTDVRETRAPRRSARIAKPAVQRTDQPHERD